MLQRACVATIVGQLARSFDCIDRNRLVLTVYATKREMEEYPNNAAPIDDAEAELSVGVALLGSFSESFDGLEIVLCNAVVLCENSTLVRR